MADADFRLAKPSDLLSVEMNSVGEPNPRAHPSCLFEKLDRTNAIHIETETLFVLRLAKMRVDLAVIFFREARRLDPDAEVDVATLRRAAILASICESRASNSLAQK